MINEELREQYEAYAAECEAGGRITLTRIENLHKALGHTRKRNPITVITIRTKPFEKVIEKCIRKKYVEKEEDITIDIIKKKVQDVVGIRIITEYVDDIYDVVEMLRHIPGIYIEPEDENDYVANPKPSGYSSYHIVAKSEVYSPLTGNSKLTPCEIQVRDLSMNYWSLVEWEAKYKKEQTPSPEVEAQLKKLAELLKEAQEVAIDIRNKSEQN